MVLYGTNVPPLWDPGISTELMIHHLRWLSIAMAGTTIYPDLYGKKPDLFTSQIGETSWMSALNPKKKKTDTHHINQNCQRLPECHHFPTVFLWFSHFSMVFPMVFLWMDRSPGQVVGSSCAPGPRTWWRWWRTKQRREKTPGSFWGKWWFNGDLMVI